MQSEINNTNFYALVTGSSKGIGYHLALELASKGYHIILTARNIADLEKAQQDIRSRYPVDVQIIACDLSQPDGASELYNFCKQKGLKVCILVNNAAAMGSASFIESDINYLDARIDTNIRALVHLCWYFIPELRAFERSYILNISSFSAFYPCPYKAVYAASKAFVNQFSLALREELASTSVKVSVVCPNGVESNADVSNRIRAHGWKGEITKIGLEELARQSLNGLFKGKGLIIPKRINQLIWRLGCFISPTKQAQLVEREFKKEFK